MEQTKRPRVFSGIQPTGGFTLGNYLGAIRNWKLLQEDADCIYCVVDLHSLTVRSDPAALRKQIREAAAMLLAAGVDPKRSILFVQSQVPQHAELSWVLSCYTMYGELSRMTQFKDKSSKHPENINAGLFTYPVLMAADILLYDADLVPVGDDQKQHVELARNIAERFNGVYGDSFVVPEGFTPKVAARVMSLLDPTSKMSKSDPNVGAKVMMSDTDEQILKKFRRAVTDSGSEVRRGEGKEGIENLMSIYSAITEKSFDEIEREFQGRGYGEFKNAVGETVVSALRPIRDEFTRIVADREYLDSVLKEGAERAASIAVRTMRRVNKRLGLNIYR